MTIKTPVTALTYPDSLMDADGETVNMDDAANLINAQANVVEAAIGAKLSCGALLDIMRHKGRSLDETEMLCRIIHQIEIALHAIDNPPETKGTP